MQVRITAAGSNHLIYGRVQREGEVLALRKDNAAYLIECGWAVPVNEQPKAKPRRSRSAPKP
jgi:hypothetical protein